MLTRTRFLAHALPSCSPVANRRYFAQIAKLQPTARPQLLEYHPLADRRTLPVFTISKERGFLPRTVSRVFLIFPFLATTRPAINLAFSRAQLAIYPFDTVYRLSLIQRLTLRLILTGSARDFTFAIRPARIFAPKNDDSTARRFERFTRSWSIWRICQARIGGWKDDSRSPESYPTQRSSTSYRSATLDHSSDSSGYVTGPHQLAFPRLLLPHFGVFTRTCRYRLPKHWRLRSRSRRTSRMSRCAPQCSRSRTRTVSPSLCSSKIAKGARQLPFYGVCLVLRATELQKSRVVRERFR